MLHGKLTRSYSMLEAEFWPVNYLIYLSITLTERVCLNVDETAWLECLMARFVIFYFKWINYIYKKQRLDLHNMPEEKRLKSFYFKGLQMVDYGPYPETQFPEPRRFKTNLKLFTSWHLWLTRLLIRCPKQYVNVLYTNIAQIEFKRKPQKCNVNSC